MFKATAKTNFLHFFLFNTNYQDPTNFIIVSNLQIILWKK